MEINEKYMHRCLELAALGSGSVAPNPMVGCVIVHERKVIGEGFHRECGGPHAEVNAIGQVSPPGLLEESTLYVSLEPCAHHGLTPPCSDLIVAKKIPRVIIGTTDPFSEVAGKGIEKLKRAGIEVVEGVLREECRELNKRFFTFHERRRPYVILKWAQTLDGFIDIHRSKTHFGEPTWITGSPALRMVHKIRAEEGAVLVGTNTAEKDNPSLTVRHWTGKNPVRAVLDKNLRLSGNLNLFDQSVKTIVFNAKKDSDDGVVRLVKIDFAKKVIPQVLETLYRERILSVIVEGGQYLLEQFLLSGLWDETHVFIGDTFFYEGISAPLPRGKLAASESFGEDKLKVFRNSP